MSATIIKVWIFGSSSDPDKTYETLQYENRSVSCSCPGWTRRIAPDGTRSCRHVRLVHMGLADEEAVRFVDYTNEPRALSEPANTTSKTKQRHATKKTKANQQQSTFGSFGHRSIIT